MSACRAARPAERTRGARRGAAVARAHHPRFAAFAAGMRGRRSSRGVERCLTRVTARRSRRACVAVVRAAVRTRRLTTLRKRPRSALRRRTGPVLALATGRTRSTRRTRHAVACPSRCHRPWRANSARPALRRTVLRVGATSLAVDTSAGRKETRAAHLPGSLPLALVPSRANGALRSRFFRAPPGCVRARVALRARAGRITTEQIRRTAVLARRTARGRVFPRRAHDRRAATVADESGGACLA